MPDRGAEPREWTIKACPKCSYWNGDEDNICDDDMGHCAGTYHEPHDRVLMVNVRVREVLSLPPGREDEGEALASARGFTDEQVEAAARAYYEHEPQSKWVDAPRPGIRIRVDLPWEEYVQRDGPNNGTEEREIARKMLAAVEPGPPRAASPKYSGRAALPEEDKG